MPSESTVETMPAACHVAPGEVLGAGRGDDGVGPAHAQVLERDEGGRRQALDLQRTIRLQREGVPEAAGREPEGKRERDAGTERGADGGAPERAPSRGDHQQRRQGERGPDLGGDGEAEQHPAGAVAARAERPERARDEGDGPQVEARQRDGADEGGPERDERPGRELHPLRSAERSGSAGGRGRRHGQARAHERRERAGVAVVVAAMQARRQDHGERGRRVLDLHVAVGKLAVGEGVGVAQVGGRVDDLAVLPDARVLHRAEPHDGCERRRAERDQRTRDGAHSAIITKGKNHGM